VSALASASARSDPLVRSGVVLLAAPCPATNVVFHALTEAFGDVTVVLERPVPRTSLARRRLRTLGVATVAGQVLFTLAVVPVLARLGRKRIEGIAVEHNLDLSPVEGHTVSVPSVNSEEARQVLRRLGPAVVVVCGTRIISASTLGCVDATFINLHAGVAPQYRGVHGGYWALAEGHPELAGATVHVVDRGIDTGPVVGQATFSPAARDSFATYPYLQLAGGVPMLVAAVRRLLSGRPLEPVAPLSTAGESRLRTHPTLWGYLATRVRHSVA